jgi:agmatinase
LKMLSHFPGGAAAPFVTFMGAPRLGDIAPQEGCFAIVGAPFGIPYSVRQIHASASDAPRAIRERSARFGAFRGHHDFDLGTSLDAYGSLPLVDWGDVIAEPHDLTTAAKRVTEIVTEQIRAGSRPIVLGGDDSTTALVIRAYEDSGPVEIVQIDAHIDFRDEVNGIRDGYSSPMRRASEMPWVRRIVHVGTRGVGSARSQDLADTLAAGNKIVSARAANREGPEAVLQHLTPGARYHIAFDCDGMDPSVMPGTSAPMPGGLDYDTIIDLVQGLAKQGTVSGINFAEYFPALDLNGITALTITRIIVNLIGASTAQQGLAAARPR